MGGLFLLSRRSQGGPGGPGGNNPLAFGKSKAKFQMEPNTGITFDDVAGVDEAKQDFMEVRHVHLPAISHCMPFVWPSKPRPSCQAGVAFAAASVIP